MAKSSNKRRPAPEKPVKTRKCVFCSKKGQAIDYKDTALLRTYISERGKIRARRVTGNCVQHQRDIAIAVKSGVATLTGNIDLTTDAGISAARGLVNQRNQESRNTSRRVIDGQRHAAMKGGNHGGRNCPFGWRKDRIRD